MGSMDATLLEIKRETMVVTADIQRGTDSRALGNSRFVRPVGAESPNWVVKKEGLFTDWYFSEACVMKVSVLSPFLLPGVVAAGLSVVWLLGVAMPASSSILRGLGDLGGWALLFGAAFFVIALANSRRKRLSKMSPGEASGEFRHVKVIPWDRITQIKKIWGGVSIQTGYKTYNIMVFGWEVEQVLELSRMKAAQK